MSRFKSIPFDVPVTLSSGQSAIVSGQLPAKAWVGVPFTIDLTFKLTSKNEGSGGRLRMAIEIRDVSILPAGEVSLAFDPSNEVDLSWKATPLTVGNRIGTLWVYAGLSPLPENAILARDLKINAVTLLGISAAWYRRIGIGLLAVGAFLILAFSRLAAKKTRMQKDQRR